MDIKLIKLIRDKGEHYRAIISLEGVWFESISIRKVDGWCDIFKMTEEEISKYISDNLEI